MRKQPHKTAHAVSLTGKQFHHRAHQYAMDEVKDGAAAEVKGEQHSALEESTRSSVSSSS